MFSVLIWVCVVVADVTGGPEVDQVVGLFLPLVGLFPSSVDR